MLGRQQIAGIPTAIHELFKNAHDAYATRVEVDFYRKTRLFILRDNGYGMTINDFESKWLALGTESRLGANDKPSDWAELMDLNPRVIMGEKGIGRLAIASIGPLVLVATRAKRVDGLKPLVLSLIHWGVFEIPGLDLQKVEIPVVEVNEPSIANAALVAELADQIRDNLKKIASLIPPDAMKRILPDLEKVRFDPSAFWKHSETLGLLDNGHGTHFFVIPTSEVLDHDIKEQEITKELVGFSNTMLPDTKTTMETAFRDHLLDGSQNELIGKSAFFTPDEWAMADHHFEGRFDDMGHFEGTVKLYNLEPVPFIMPNRNAAGKKSRCGPFSFKFAFVQGEASETSMPLPDWQSLSEKCNAIGGIYVFKSGIRVLPYGRPDADFLDIEFRRTKAAKDWVFSYRRMFGAVEVDPKNNPELEEKAGREGFRRNIAYRQFRDLLSELLQQLAKEFLRTNSQSGEEYNIIKDNLTKNYKILKRREDNARKKSKDFEDGLKTFFESLNNDVISKKIAGIEDEVMKRANVLLTLDDPVVAAQGAIELERYFWERYEALCDDTLRIKRPPGVTLKKRFKYLWASYQKAVNNIEKDDLHPFRDRILAELSRISADARIAVDRRKRSESAIEDRQKSARSMLRRLQSDIDIFRKGVDDHTRATIRREVRRFEDTTNQLLLSFENTDLGELSDEAYKSFHQQILTQVEDLKQSSELEMSRLRDQLEAVAEALRQGDSLVEIADAAADTNEENKERLNDYIEYAQAGSAIGIIQHEFLVSVENFKRNIDRLKPWSDGTPALVPIHQDLKLTFEHLDGFMKIIDPLSRRAQRVKRTLPGEKVVYFLNDIFGPRLIRHNIELKATTSFKESMVDCYWSTFLSVFINVMDNAIYWISKTEGSEPWIQLDYSSDCYLISNGGPGIDPVDEERIFQLGESDKYDGKGMGLYISQTALNRDGWEISLQAVGKNVRPVFRISPIDDKDERNEH